MNTAVRNPPIHNAVCEHFTLSVKETPYLLCDVDGTLAETEGEGHLPAFNQAFEEAGLDWHWSESDYHALLRYTGGLVRMKAHARAIGRHDLAEDNNDQLLKEVHKNKNRIYSERVRSGAIKPLPHVADTLKAWVAAGGKWAAVTTTSKVNWAVLWKGCLEPLGIPEPELSVCGEDVHTKKPHPAAYDLAVRKLGIAPERAIAVEDSPNGVRAAVAAGIRCVVIPSVFFADDAVPGAEAVIPSWSQLHIAD